MLWFHEPRATLAQVCAKFALSLTEFSGFQFNLRVFGLEISYFVLGRLSEIQDPTQRMLAITRWYLSSWHLKPPVFICQLQLPWWGLTSFFVRELKNLTTQFWVRFITVNGIMAIPIWEQLTTSQNKFRITHQFLHFISWTESAIGAWMCRFDQKASFWAIRQLQSWRARPIFISWTTVHVSIPSFVQWCSKLPEISHKLQQVVVAAGKQRISKSRFWLFKWKATLNAASQSRYEIFVLTAVQSNCRRSLQNLLSCVLRSRNFDWSHEDGN